MPEGRPREAHVAVEASEGPVTEAIVDTPPLTIAFYTCGDGNGPRDRNRRAGEPETGCTDRKFGLLYPTNAYRQLALCLSTPVTGSPGTKHAYPQVELNAAFDNHTFGVQDAIAVFNGLPAEMRVDNIYFIGHGTGVPPGYFFSGYNRRNGLTGPCLSSDDFSSVQTSLFHLSTDYRVMQLSDDPELVTALNNAHDGDRGLRHFRDFYGQTFARGLGVNGNLIQIAREAMDRRWVLSEGEWNYTIRREASRTAGGHVLNVLGQHTPHLRDCYELVNAMKRRLASGGHIGFLSCFTGDGNFVSELHRRITQVSSPAPAVADVTIGAYRDYFVTGYTRLGRARTIVDWHNKVINHVSGTVISEKRGRCGEDIIPDYQTEAPSPALGEGGLSDDVLGD